MVPDSLPAQVEILQSLESDREQALARFFEIVRPRLKRIVNFRLDYRLNGRISESDVIQEAYVRASKRIDSYLERQELPFFVWLRMELHQMLQDVHRHHFDAEKRDARRDQVFLRPNTGCETSMAIAAHLVGNFTSPSRLVEKAEQIAMVQQTLEQLPELDREIIALRHFEELSNIETAEYLGIEASAASKRYLRALKRLREIMIMVSGNDGP
jgi:RNA polymerase sigma-70 factor (subfamily 1)